MPRDPLREWLFVPGRTESGGGGVSRSLPSPAAPVHAIFSLHPKGSSASPYWISRIWL